MGELVLEGSSPFGPQKSAPQTEHHSLLAECLPGHSSLEPTILLNTVFLNSLGAQGYTRLVETRNLELEGPGRLPNSACYVQTDTQAKRWQKVTATAWSVANTQSPDPPA